MSSSPALVIGIMSGTSTDGVDGALLKVTSATGVSIEATTSIVFPEQVRGSINSLIQQRSVDLDQLGHLHSELGVLYAQVALQLQQHAVDQEIFVIGCHGQTIRHRPDDTHPFTMQIGNGAIISQRTGIPVVTDFRSADMAVGGQGAPLAPAFHQAVFSSRDETRAVVNLGGIANFTHLPANHSGTVSGYDTGPANTLLDHWCQQNFNAPFDRNGVLAASGKVNQALLDKLLSDSYFAQPPPKSTGREHFNLHWLGQILENDPKFDAIDAHDIMSTLAALTAKSVADQINQLSPAVDAVYLCGGGSANLTVVDMLSEEIRGRIEDTAALGIEPQWVEACAFGWMAYQAIQRTPATLPSVTGGKKSTVTGAVYYPD